MPSRLTVDFVSDVSCPWSVIGLRGPEQALARAADVVAADIVLRPFERNPAMPAAGQDIAEHIAEKYGATPEHSPRPIARRSARVRRRSASP